MADGTIIVDPEELDQPPTPAVRASARTITVDPRDLDQSRAMAAQGSARTITVDPSELDAPPAPPASLPQAQPANPPAYSGPTISAAPPRSLMQRARSAVAESAIGHAVSQTMPYLAQALDIEPSEMGDTEHAGEIIAPGAAFDRPGVAKGVAEFAGGLTTPGNALMMAGSGGFGELSSILGESAKVAVPKLISLGFSAQMAQGAVQRWPELKKAISEKRYDDAKQIATEAGLGLLFSAKAFQHAGTPEPIDYGGTLDRSKATAPEPIVEGDTVPDYLKTHVTDRIAQQIAKTDRINQPVEIPELPETTAPPPILSRPIPRTPMEELSAQAAEARRPQEFRQQLTQEISDQIISRLRDEGLLEPPSTNVVDRRVVRPEDVEPYEPPRTFMGRETGPAAVVPRGENLLHQMDAEGPPRINLQPSETQRALPAAPQAVGAGESLAPETLSTTLKAQTDALEAGTNKVVYFPKGTETIPAPPDNATVTVVKGNKPGAGTYYHDSSITPEQVRSAVKDGTYGELLGHVQTKEEATAPGSAPAAVVARDRQGNEVKASLIDASKPDLVQRQTETLSKQFPEATIGVEPPERVISGRRGIPTKPPTAPQGITADSRRMANLAIGRFRNPIERQYATDVWHSMMGQDRVPVPPTGMSRVRADQITNGLADISRGNIAGRVPDPRTVYAPDVLDEAQAMMAHTHDFLSQQERPGRYFADMGDETSLTGRGPKLPITAVRSQRGQFPWFANLKESPGDLEKALKRGEGPTYDRLLTSAADHITRTRQEFTSMARSVEPDLEGLANEVRDLDPDLAAFLTDSAQGKISTWTETRQDQLAKIEGRISDARQAIEFGRAVDDLGGQERASSLPGAHEGREETAPLGRPAGEGSGPSEAPEQRSVTPRQSGEGILPGLEGAVAEQSRAAGIEQSRRLSEETARPLGNIEEQAGTMERESPLFRGTEASPQSEMFGEPRQRFGSRSREALSSATSTATDQSQALHTENLRLEEQLRNRPDAPAGERRAAQERIEQNRQMIAALERSGNGEAGFATLDLIRDVVSGRLPKEAWQQFVAGPFIEKGLGIGDKYAKIREADPDVAAGLHLLDNAPAYFRAKTAQTIYDIIGGLSRDQERLFTLMADADSRENLRTNHPAEYRKATTDPAIQEALRKYRPIEQQLTAARERMGGATLDRDYLRRVYDQHVSGIGQAEAPGTSERATTAFDRVIQPQRLGNMSREATAEYHYQHGLHEFGPAFGTKFLATNLRGLEDQVARNFITKATEIKPGAAEPRFITYRGEKYYRPDIARDMREAGQKNIQAYDRYDPTAGLKYPQQGTSRYLGPRNVVRALNDYSAGQGQGPGAVRRFLQEQVIGYGFGLPHVANILRRVTQSAPLGAANPEAWARAWKVAFGKELRDRGIKGLDDPTFDKLMQHGSITTGEMANLKQYWGGNLNPANWARSLAKVGHKLIFEPGSFGGLGGVDQRARIYIADLVKSQNPSLTDEQIAQAVNTQLGDYNRANWTDRQKTLSKFMLFPGWDTSSIRWVIQHPLKTTVPPALLIWTANQILNRYGQNRPEDASDIQNIHWGDRSIGVTLLRESMARNLMRPAVNYAQSKIRGESGQRAIGEAARGVSQGAGSLVGTLRPDITAGIDLAMNRQSPFGGKELVSKSDYELPGRILPNRALEKQAALVVRHAVPALDRMIGSDQEIDFKAFAGSNVGLPNYKSGAEQRLARNTAEAMEVSQTLSRLAKTDRVMASTFIRDPDNAAYALFRNEFSEMSKTLKRMDDAKQTVASAKNLSATEKSQRVAQIDHARQNLLQNADGLDRLLFERKQENRGRTVPRTAPAAGSSLPGVPRAGIPSHAPAGQFQTLEK